MDFTTVRLQVQDDRLAKTEAFYSDALGLLDLRFGATRLELLSADGDAFYHFALLVPGDRFRASLDWARERVELLPGGDIDDVIFDFANWDALACYFHDPAGNIVELIAHGEIGAHGRTGSFAADELLGFSELGLVGDVGAMAAELEQLGLRVWDGTLDEPGRLAFVGEKGRTLILSPDGRGWLPTGRPAEPWPVDVVLSGVDGEVTAEAHVVRGA